MPDDLPMPEPAPQESGGNTRRIVALAAAVLAGAVAYFLMRSSIPPLAPSPAASQQQGSLGPEARAYLADVGVDHLEVSRAENFLHQEVTTISGEITNGGARQIGGVELTLEFRDEANQVTQREVRALFGAPGPPIPAGDYREFEVSFEHISAMWNMRPPVARVTAVQFAAAK